jgi:hypothetical protein
MHRVLTAARRALALALPAMLSVVALTAMPATASASTPAITFDVQLFDPCLRGSDAADVTISVVWSDSAGALKANGTATHPFGGGVWEFCSPGNAMTPGDKLKVSDGSYTRAYTVPNVTLHIDRVNNVYVGTGPAGRTLRLCIQTGDFGRCHSVRVGQDGQWSYDPHEDLIHYRAGYGVSLDWTSPNHDTVFIDGINAPFLAVTLGTSKFSGETDPLENVSVTVSNARTGTGSATGGQYGDFSGRLRKPNGNPYVIDPGDHVSAPSLASDADWIVPKVDAAADAATDVVNGRCHDSGTSAQLYFVDVYRSPGHLRGTATRQTDSDGSFSINMRTDVGDFYEKPANIKHGDKVVVGCIQTTGDVAQVEIWP